MLKNLLVKNFRTHENLNMEFHSGVNVIWGLPGSGKTNILRAINWIMSNKPKYDSVCSHFAKNGEVKVELEFDNGHVSLSKNSKSEEFVLNKRKSFSVTNRSIPEPIAQLINLSEVNVIQQLDPQFLITSTPGDVGQTINRITKIEKIDGWISKLTTLINTAKWKIESLQAECETLDKEVRAYDDIEDLEKVITHYETMNDTFEELTCRITRLEELNTQLSNRNKRIAQLQTLDESLVQSFAELKEVLSNIQTKADTISGLTRLESEYIRVLRKKRNIDEVLLETENFNEIQTILQEIKSREDMVDQINQFTRCNDKCTNLASRLESQKADYIAAIRKLGICPTCQNKITEKHIKELEASL